VLRWLTPGRSSKLRLLLDNSKGAPPAPFLLHCVLASHEPKYIHLPLNKPEANMAAITIRNLDDEIKELLRLSAAKNGHSMEEEARIILRQALQSTQPSLGLGSKLQQRFSTLSDKPLELPPR